MDTKVCVVCGEERPIHKFRFSFNSRVSRKSQCVACLGKRERASQRIKFFEAIGNKCFCCGENDVRFLTLDHADDSGAEHRKTLKCHQIYAAARKEGYPKEKYQVLCFNCNSGRSANGGVCPHKDLLSKEEAWTKINKWTEPLGRKHVAPSATAFTGGFDVRRMQANRRVLKPCSFCGEEFGSNEMVRHKRDKHVEEMMKKRAECLAMGRNK